ncbi:MAG: VCBS repeat-containing protein [Prosthecobacter sp.]|uniref:FG-GAP repeat domain-containing protein n=1 Tax=Prosthecobacter sp. TaxID=1965333 RepID=UPI0025F691C2|nr:VCBS repeat-containing protein [Prosthecobacter sp.]MCF7785327.1 VCBS repeat-containing protein [Prosthecobacter sp.]
MRLAFLPLLLATSALADKPALYFDGPEIVKLDWNTASPHAADFNGDGLSDLAIVNASRARIEFLIQRKDGVQTGAPEKSARTDRWNPILEVSRFDKQPLVIGHAALALVVGDWNGDKKADIAFITDEDKLVLRMQDDKGAWAAKREFTLDSTADDTEVLVARDLNGDGRDDIALLTSTRLMVLLQTKAGEWAEPQNYAMGEGGCAGLSITDLNDDGRADIFYTSPDGDALLVRLQHEGTTFGEEWRLEIDPSRHWLHAIRLGGKKNGVAWIQDETNMVEVARLTQGAAEPDADRAATIRYAMPPTESQSGAVAYGDLTGDGHADVIMSEPKAARAWLFQGSANGTFTEGREFPILSGVESLAIADVDGDKKAELVLLSPGEQSIGVAHWQDNRLLYPEIIYQAKEGETLLTLTTDSAVLCVTEIKSKPQLVTLRKTAGAKGFTATTQELTIKTGRINGIRVVDANQDGRGDLALFSNLGPMQLLLSTTDTKTPFKRVEGIPDSFVSKLAPAALTTGDLDGDGKEEIIIAHQQLARAFKVDADGKANIVEQFNAPDAAAELHSALVSRKNGKVSVLLIDATHSKLHELSAGADRVYRPDHTHALPAMTPEQCVLMTAEKSTRLLLLGKSSFQLAPLDGSTLKLETVATFDSELKDTAPSDLIAASFSGEDVDDIALLDTAKSRVIEIFQPVAGQKWESAMYFRVFETDPHFRGKTGLENEPHDYAALDLNGDGRLDLCLLTHDRALLYVRKK